MSYKEILYDVADNILTITLNRPEKLNAFTGTMMSEMIDAFQRANKDDAIRCIIVTGAGRAFCAGADLSAGASTFDATQRADRPERNAGPVGSVDWSDERVRDGGGRVTLEIFECLKPVIAACNGPAVGIGATMQCAMDIRLGSEAARVGFVFSRRGIVPEAASSWFLPRIVGIQRALAWCFSGKVFDAKAGFLRNEILPFGLKAIVARVSKAPSWLDNKECIVLDYSETSLVASHIRDEIREIEPGFYLGKVYWDSKRIFDFSLDFRKKKASS